MVLPSMDLAPLMILDCNEHGDSKNSGRYHTACSIYSDNGQLTNLNRYSIREWSHNANDKKYDYWFSTLIIVDFLPYTNFLLVFHHT